MDSSIPRCILLIVLIVVGGFFSGAETAFSYCNRIRMKTLAEDGDKAAGCVVKILDKFDEMLVTVLIMINVMHVLSSSVATILAVSLMPKNTQLATLLSTILLTLVVFFVSETLPKSIARANCDAYARYSSFFIWALVVVLTPASFLFTKLGDLCKRLFLGKKKEEPSMTEDELSDIVEKVEDEGILEPEESRIIQSAIEFGDIQVKDIFTPADKVLALEKNLKPEEFLETLKKERFSRVPVYDHDLSHIIGILQTKEYLAKVMNAADEEEVEWKDYLKPAFFVKPDMKLEALFESMGRRRSHFAIVSSSRGAMLGVVTMEDILEELVGDIWDEDDSVPAVSGKEAVQNG